MSLSQLPINPNQSSISRRCTRDEARVSKHHVQLQTEPRILQFSLPILQLENKALVIVLEFEPTFCESYEMMFEGCFENKAEKQMVTRISTNEDHCFWLQGPLNLFTRERRANYNATILLCILEFLNV